MGVGGGVSLKEKSKFHRKHVKLACGPILHEFMLEKDSRP